MWRCRQKKRISFVLGFVVWVVEWRGHISFHMKKRYGLRFLYPVFWQLLWKLDVICCGCVTSIFIVYVCMQFMNTVLIFPKKARNWSDFLATKQPAYSYTNEQLQLGSQWKNTNNSRIFADSKALILYIQANFRKDLSRKRSQSYVYAREQT